MNRPHHPVFICICALLAAVTPAMSAKSESHAASALAKQPSITLTTPEWDNPVLALDIDAYYIQLSSEVKAGGAMITIEQHQAGEKTLKVISSPGLSLGEELPLRLDAALYSNPEDSGDFTKVTLVAKRQAEDGNRSSHVQGITRGQIPSLAKFKSKTHGTFPLIVPASGKVPLFYIAYIPIGVSFTPAQTPEALIAANPETVLWIGYLNTYEQPTEQGSRVSISRP